MGGGVVSVGGQVSNTLAIPLHRSHATLLGTPADSIDRCEDRARFSSMCDQLGVPQPPWAEVRGTEAAVAFARFDKDGSGQISLAEFVKIMVRPTKTGTPMTEKEATEMFNRFDKDGSGEISYEEFGKEWGK